MMVMMKSYFFFSKDSKNFLFEDLDIHGTADLCLYYISSVFVILSDFENIRSVLYRIIGAFLVCLVCTVLLEGLKSLQYYYRIQMTQSSKQTESNFRLKCIYSGVCLLHVVDVLVAYLLMLAVMSYDAYILVSVLLGSGCGYFIFGAVNTMFRFGTKTVELNGFDNPACKPSTTSDRELHYSPTQIPKQKV